MTVAWGVKPDDESPARERAIETLLGDGSWRALHPYAKWRGVFWRLPTLLELGADRSDDRCREMADAVLAWLASPQRQAGAATRTVGGRTRWCASQDGLGLHSAVACGLAGDPRSAELASALASWQWPDGGWNCDKRPAAHHSSFHETHGPLRGLAVYARATGSTAAREAARRAADFLLAHRLYRSCRTGAVAGAEYAKLHWPAYWHYDLLAGLRGLAAAGALGEPGAAEALEVVRSARRPDGTWRPSGRRYWKRPGAGGSNVEAADLSAAAPLVLTALVLDVLRGVSQD